MSSSSEGSSDYDYYRIEPFLLARNTIFSNYPRTDSPIVTRDSFICGKTPVLMTGLIRCGGVLGVFVFVLPNVQGCVVMLGPIGGRGGVSG